MKTVNEPHDKGKEAPNKGTCWSGTLILLQLASIPGSHWPQACAPVLWDAGEPQQVTVHGLCAQAQLAKPKPVYI